MKKILIIVFVLSLSTLFCQTCQEVWNQSPYANGVDIEFETTAVGDDWLVPDNTYICAIHFFLSWQGDVVGDITSIDVSIWSDVPAGVDLPWSHPGSML